MSKNELIESIKKRRSPVVFSNRLIEQHKIDLLFEAARWAPSSMNEQPWRFVYATHDNDEAFKRMYNCLLEGNKPWNSKIPLLILVAVKTNFEYKNRENVHAKYDAASAVANLTFQANSMDLWIHQMAGFDATKVKNDLKIPDGFEPVVMLSVGYLGDVDSADESLRNRELTDRNRKPVSEIVFRNSWKNI